MRPELDWLRQRLLVFVVFAAAMASTFLLWRHEQNNADLDHQISAEFGLRELVSRIEQRMLIHEQVLRGVQGLYSASDHVGREEFRNYVEALQLGADFAGLEGLGMLPYVPASQKATHVEGMRRQGFVSYAIQPPGDRAEGYAPLVQLEPSVGRNLRAFGFDAYSDPVRRTAMDRARDSGAVTLSAKLTRLDESGTDVPAGFVMFLPVYHASQLPDSVAARRALLAGWVVAPFRMPDLMASLYGERLPGVDVQIYDGVETTPAALMYDSAAMRGEHLGSTPAVTEYLQVGARTWTVAVHFQPGMLARESKDKSQIIAIAGACMSLLLAALTWVLVTDRTRALAAATQMTTELREAKNHFELIFDASPDGVVISWLEDGQVIDVNGGFTALMGYGREDVVGQPLLALPIWASAEDRDHYVRELHDKGFCENLEVRLRRQDGQYMVGILSAKIVSFKGYPGVVGVIRDITGRKAVEQRIAHMAQHDALTGLPNRALLADRLGRAIAQARRHGGRMALMYVDLDRFKPVNDSLGHQVGDLLLRAVAQRMQACVRASDTVARMGGDEFVVLLPEIHDERDASQVAEKIRAALNQPFELEGGHRVSISSSTGIAIFPDQASDEIELAKRADDAMYQSKTHGRNRVEFYRNG